jgi:NAD(P)-dependent dehydrogenase (short-subunit alcohol dehydrogenase family)
MNIDLQGKVILVTGAGGGMGRGIAEASAEAGATVVAGDLDVATVAETVEILVGRGQVGLPLQLDVTREASIIEAVRKTVAQYGRLDGLVNNAGVVRLGSALDASAADRDVQHAVNVEGLYLCCQVAARRMIEQKTGGAIVNIASEAGKVGYPNSAFYNATKAAVISLTRTMAQEWSASGINVNSVCPGGVNTPMLVAVAEHRAALEGRAPDTLFNEMTPGLMDRHIEAIEVGRVVAFLLSEYALIIRGQSINVDGNATPY